MNLINKRKSKNIISQSDINIISPLGQLESRKILHFQKVESVNRINTFGSQPIIVYKKSAKNPNQNQKNSNQISRKNSRYEKMNKSESETKVISDGNLEKKIQKFNSFSKTQKNFNNNNKQIIKTKSFHKNIILIEKDKKLKEEYERKKNLNEQKLFSKTVRDSNMRPVFPKNKNKQMTLTKNEFYDKNKNENKKNKENEDFEIKKNLMMNQLVQNAVVVEMKKYQNDLNGNKKNLELIKNNKKREYLEENGITTSTEELTINGENDKIINENNEQKNKKRIYDTSSHAKINNYLYQEDMIKNNNIPISPKIKNKPEIEQFEYIIKINEEKKKLISEMRKIYHQNKPNNEIKKNNFISSKVYPSFRTKNKLLYEEENKTSNDTTEHSYSLKDRKNHRTTQEIHQYLKEKKLKYKQLEETKQLEKNKKLFVRFKNLYNLNMKDNNNNYNKEAINDNLNINFKGNKKIKIEERKDEFIETEEDNINDVLDKNKVLYENSQNPNNIRRKKEINDYYIGNDSTIRNNNSTLVDVNEYYLNILESQQLLVNSKLKKIEDENEYNKSISNEENNEENLDENNEKTEQKNNLQLDENELNTKCISNENIKKITEKELTKTSNSKKVTEEILNTSSIEELKLKINSTLQRANIFLSKQNASNNNITENTTSNNQNNINTNTNNNTNNNNQNVKDSKEEEIVKEESTNNINEIQEKQSNNKTENVDEEEKNNISNNEISKIESKKEVKQTLDSRVVLNLIEVIKFIIQRKIFVILYESYINHAIYQQYTLAFSFLVAICKQYPFKKLEEFYNYKTYNYAFRQLLRPFNRYNFKYFISRFQIRKKVEYLEVLLTKMIKFKALERIYLYGQYMQEEDDEENFRLIIMKIMSTLLRPHLLEAFYILKENLNQINNEKEEEDLHSNLSDDKIEEKKEKEENEVNFNISDDDDILSDNSFNNNNDKLNNILNQEKENNKEDNQNNNNLKNIINTNSDKYNEDNNQNIENQKENNQIESIESNEDKSDINNQRRKNDSSLKMNSFLYESLDSSQKSSFSIEPNSLDNDKLHKLKLLLLEKNKNFENGFNDNYNIDEIYMGNSSKKSDKSLQELIKMGKNENKTLSDMMEENSYQKSPEEKNDFNNLKKTLRSQISEGKNETLKDEGIKVINETKDTKEVTDDSNTINLNTNNKSDNEKNKIGIDTNSNSDIKKGNIQNIKINNIQKKIDYEEEEKNEIKILIEESKEIAEKEPEIPKKNNKILKNYKIIERPEKLENLITEEDKNTFNKNNK